MFIGLPFDFNHYFGISKRFGINQKGFPGITEDSTWKFLDEKQKIHWISTQGQSRPTANRHLPPQRWRLSISLRFAITLGRLRVMYLGSRWKTPWGFGSGIPTTIIGTPWNLTYHHCEPFILDDLCYPQTKIAASHPAGWPHEHSGSATIGVKIVCSKCQKNTFKQPTVPTPKP